MTIFLKKKLPHHPDYIGMLRNDKNEYCHPFDYVHPSSTLREKKWIEGLFCGSEAHYAAFFQGQQSGSGDGVAGDGNVHP